jgi:hypothetical protein
MDKFWRGLAGILPRKLVYFACIRVWVYATSGKYSNTIVSELKLHEAISRWDK